MNGNAQVTEPTFWMPAGASTVAASVDELYYFIYWLSVALFVGIIGAAAYFTLRYRRRHAQEIPHGPHHSTFLEVSWTVIPLILVVFIFVWSFRTYMGLVMTPGDAMEIGVTGQQWSWTFNYKDPKDPKVGFDQPGKLVVPAGRNVKLVMGSRDVLHSFWVPAFRVKHDIVPGQTSTLWFNALEPGKYPVLCTEYCGLSHSDMLAEVEVMEAGKYDAWLQKTLKESSGLSPVALGEKLFQTQACFTCHSKDGSKLIGPSLKGLFGKDEEIEGGGKAKVDEAYLRESIKEPRAKLVKGYGPLMPENYKNLKEDEYVALVEFIKSLK